MKTSAVLLMVVLGTTFARAGECDVAKAELAKYWQAVTGRADAPVELAVEPSVSASGNDAYVIRSEKVEGWKGGGARYGVKITGSNGRSVLYGVYDLLERRGGCGWFWDGDRVPKREKIDLSGLDVREESKFAYRGIRYFAHRGLTRFQAEHWGFDDWTREIDWCLKKRLNLFMLRIGQDDYFQKAFPDVCAYPDASKPLPGQHAKFDNRSLFWPLEFRGELRKKVMEYAFARGMMAPEDFGTMTHWYSRTPQDFLDRMKPDFLPQAPGAYGEPSGLVWDIRQSKWLDAYWKLTDTGIREYGRPGLLHTIGIAERNISTNRAENLALKTEWTNLMLSEAKRRHPGSVRLLAGWDLYCMKEPDEVKDFLKGIPEDVVIWDYEADASINTWFGEWDIVGKRPYAFGVFMAYEAGLDPRTDYAKIAARQRLIENDPMCKGYILWPESSHVDSMGLEWFAKNSWRADAGAVEPVVADYCARRYPDEAAAMEDLWMKTVPVSTNNLQQNIWRWNAFLPVVRLLNGNMAWEEARRLWPSPKANAVFSDLSAACRALKALDWEKSEFLKRDMTDLARVWADRLAIESENRLIDAYFRWIDGEKAAADEVRRLVPLTTRVLKTLSRLIDLHTDYSICDAYDRLGAVHPVAYSDFFSVLVDNAANFYCASHQAELARVCYIPAFEAFAAAIIGKIDAGDRTPPGGDIVAAFRERAMKTPYAEMRSTTPRTRANFNQVLDDLVAFAAEQDWQATEPKPLKESIYAKPIEAAAPEGLDCIGRLRRRPSHLQRRNGWSVGCETLDRDYGDFGLYKRHLPDLGVTRARLFSGWAKTEKSKGCYSYDWLDRQVKATAGLGLEPWICLSYGNPVYGSDFELGMAVKTVVRDKAAFEAWLAYCRRTVERYRDTVRIWEIWNEPYGQQPDYATMVLETARVIRSVQPDARVMVTAIDYDKGDHVKVAETLKAAGAEKLVSLWSWHPYEKEVPEENWRDYGARIAAVLAKYDVGWKLVQGEGGCPSQLEYAHAFSNYPWTEISQAKWDLRQMAVCAAQGVGCNVFTFADLRYPNMLQSFGMVRCNLKHEVIYRRPAFLAVSNMANAFPADVTPVGCDEFRANGRTVTVARFLRDGRPRALVWYSDRVPDDTLAFDTATVELRGQSFEDPAAVDLLNGRIYRLPAFGKKGDGTVFAALPIRDVPILVIEAKEVL